MMFIAGRDVASARRRSLAMKKKMGWIGLGAAAGSILLLTRFTERADR